MAFRNIISKPLLHLITKSSIPLTTPQFSQSFSKTPSSDHKNLVSLCSVFQRYGFPSSEIHDILKKKKDGFLLNTSPLEIEKSFNTILSIKPSQDFLVSIVSGCPVVLQPEFLQKWQHGIAQLRIKNATTTAINNVLGIAAEFEVSPDDVFGCVKCLQGLGCSENTISRVLETVPAVIVSGEDKLRDTAEFLMVIGIQRGDIDRVFSLFPEVLSFGLENRLKPLLDEFADLGFSLTEVRREVLREPEILGLENGELSHCLEMLRNLKCRVAIKDNIFKNGEFRAAYRVKQRIDCLRKHGLTYRDACKVIWKDPRVVLYEIEEIEEKIDFLLRKMKFEIQCLVEVPEYLGVNLHKQIIPRFTVIDYLQSRDGLGDKVGLRELVTLSRLRFYNMYIKPYPECEKIYGRFSGDAMVRSSRHHHPVGIWKLFRPQQYQESRNSVKNMKSFMESLH